MVRSKELIGDDREVSVFIDLEKCRCLGRSPEEIIAERRCPECQVRMAESSQLPRAETQIREIARCCSKKEGFITPEMPLLEIAFRILLALKNQPLSLHELHHQVTEEWATPSNPKSVSVEGLQRILARDTYYCFGMVTQELRTAG